MNPIYSILLSTFAVGSIAAADVITDPPGDEFLYFRNVDGFSIDFMGMPTIESGAGCVQKIRIDGEDLYMYRPAYTSPYGSDYWIKGRMTGEGMEFPLPQTILHETGEDEYGQKYDFLFELNLLEIDHNDETGEDMYESLLSNVPNRILLKKQEDGSYGYEPELVNLYDPVYDLNYEYPKFIVGVTVSDDPTLYMPQWTYYGDFYNNIKLFDKPLVTAPEGLVTEKWTVVSETKGHEANVGFVGDDVYFQGLFDTMPEAWVKGYMADGKVTIPCGQYMGINEKNNQFCCFFAGDMEYWFDEDLWETQFSVDFDDAGVLEYDVANHRMTTDQGFVIFSSEDALVSSGYMQTPTIMIQPDGISLVPELPEVIGYVDYGHWGKYAAVEFLTTNLNVDGYWLGPDSTLSWRLISDGEPVIFAPGADYPNIKEVMEWVPYDFTDRRSIMIDNGMIGDTTKHTVYYHVESKIYTALQARYVDPVTGMEYETEPYVFWGELNGMEGVSSEPAEEVYYNLQGMKINRPEHGPYIKIKNGKTGKRLK